MPTKLAVLQAEIIACRLCPRLVAYREQIAEVKRRAYLDWTYWGRPVPSFGDPRARLLIVGLAPGAHGANRTGRMFTGDRSGEFLYRALYEAGFASQPTALHKDDGLTLHDAYITAPVHCAPPDNKPSPEEFAACRPYLVRDIALHAKTRVVVVLGRIGWDSYLSVMGLRKSAFPFGHGEEYALGEGLPTLLCCYHPSQQNTSTGRLTAAMLRDIFLRAKALVDA